MSVGVVTDRGIGRRTYLGAALAILLLGAVVRLWNLGGPSLWTDEVLTDNRANASFGDAVRLILDSGNQIPLYFLSLHLFPTPDEALLRYPGVMVGILGIAALVGAAGRLYNRSFALAAGLLLALSPYHIWLSRTARPYALLFLLGLLASYFFVCLLRGEQSRALWAGFILSSMGAYLTQYFAVALPLAQYAVFAFVLRQKRIFFRKWMLAQAMAALPVLVWVVLLAQREVVQAGIGWAERPTVLDPFLTLLNMTIGYRESLPWYAVPGAVVAVVGLGAGFYQAARANRADLRDFYWLWLIGLPLVVVWIASQFLSVYVDRYFVFALPGILCLLLLGWRRLDLRVAVLGVALVAATGAINVLTTWEQGEEEFQGWRSAVAYVEDHRLANDGLLIDLPIQVLCVLYYLDEPIPYSWGYQNNRYLQSYDPSIQRLWIIEETEKSGPPWPEVLGDVATVTEMHTVPGLEIYLADFHGPVAGAGA